MADKNPSQFAAAGAITGAELTIVYQSGAMKKISLTDLFASALDATFAALEASDLTVTGDAFAALPEYADEAAAVIGGLTENQLYRTATGEVRIKLADE